MFFSGMNIYFISNEEANNKLHLLIFFTKQNCRQMHIIRDATASVAQGSCRRVAGSHWRLPLAARPPMEATSLVSPSRFGRLGNIKFLLVTL